MQCLYSCIDTSANYAGAISLFSVFLILYFFLIYEPRYDINIHIYYFYTPGTIPNYYFSFNDIDVSQRKYNLAASHHYLDSKFIFESHLRSVSSVIAQKLGLLRKSYKIFGDPCVLLKYFNFLILSCFDYCSPVWFLQQTHTLNFLLETWMLVSF